MSADKIFHTLLLIKKEKNEATISIQKSSFSINFHTLIFILLILLIISLESFPLEYVLWVSINFFDMRNLVPNSMLLLCFWLYINI